MITKTCYIWIVNKGLLADYFERNYLKFQIIHGRLSLTKWAAILHFSKSFLSQVMNGKIVSMSYHAARHTADVLQDYEIMEILGYDLPAPEERKPFFGYPPEFVEALKSARDKVATLGIADSSPEGKAIYNSEITKVLNNRSTSTDESGNT